MAKKLITWRANDETLRQITMLITAWGQGTTRSEVIAKAIDRLFQQEAKRK